MKTIEWHIQPNENSFNTGASQLADDQATLFVFKACMLQLL